MRDKEKRQGETLRERKMEVEMEGSTAEGWTIGPENGFETAGPPELREAGLERSRKASVTCALGHTLAPKPQHTSCSRSREGR